MNSQSILSTLSSQDFSIPTRTPIATGQNFITKISKRGREKLSPAKMNVKLLNCGLTQCNLKSKTATDFSSTSSSYSDHFLRRERPPKSIKLIAPEEFFCCNTFELPLLVQYFRACKRKLWAVLCYLQSVAHFCVWPRIPPLQLTH